jgi:hypothetical protein
MQNTVCEKVRAAACKIAAKPAAICAIDVGVEQKKM